MSGVIKHHTMFTMFTTPFHINYTILSLVIISYLCYGPLMGINAPNFGIKYNVANLRVPTSTTGRRNTGLEEYHAKFGALQTAI